MMDQADLRRLQTCMRRAERGEELVLAFLGGSITQGSLASVPKQAYAYLVYSWWKETFPKAEFHYVNGGIGGTTSHYGVSRAVTDVLMYQPDVVVVDFSVNDDADPFFQETYEGVIRRLLSWDSRPAVLILNNVFYETGKNAQEYHNAVGDWYGVPHVSIRDTVWQKVQAGEYTIGGLTPDGLHPNDLGHQLVAGEITAFLQQVKESLQEADKAAGALQEADGLCRMGLPEPMTANAYEGAKRLTIREICPVLSGFRADTREKAGYLDHFKNGWIGRKPGDGITFEIEVSCIAVQYRKTIQKPALRAQLVLDGDEAHPVLLDGNFEEDWGDCLYLETVLHHGEWKMHTVQISILPCEEETGGELWTPFYLMALIVA